MELSKHTPKRWLRLDRRDNVAVALTPLSSGETIEGIRVSENIPLGHKIALEQIAAGASIYKYANIIGVATAPIELGRHVHTHNLAMPASVQRGLSQEFRAATDLAGPARGFQGFRRPGGGVG